MLTFIWKWMKSSNIYLCFGDINIVPKEKKKKKKNISSNYFFQSQPSEYSSVGFAKLLIIVRLY